MIQDYVLIQTFNQKNIVLLKNDLYFIKTDLFL